MPRTMSSVNSDPQLLVVLELRVPLQVVERAEPRLLVAAGSSVRPCRSPSRRYPSGPSSGPGRDSVKSTSKSTASNTRPRIAAGVSRYPVGLRGVWRSLVARSVRVGEVPSSNLGTPTGARGNLRVPPRPVPPVRVRDSARRRHERVRVRPATVDRMNSVRLGGSSRPTSPFVTTTTAGARRSSCGSSGRRDVASTSCRSSPGTRSPTGASSSGRATAPPWPASPIAPLAGRRGQAPPRGRGRGDERAEGREPGGGDDRLLESPPWPTGTRSSGTRTSCSRSTNGRSSRLRPPGRRRGRGLEDRRAASRPRASSSSVRRRPARSSCSSTTACSGATSRWSSTGASAGDSRRCSRPT